MRLRELRIRAVRRPDLVVLGALVTAGVGLRLWLMVEWRPAFLGYPDSYGYISNSEPEGYFVDGLRPIGYPLFLAAARQLSSSLASTVVLQHLLGIAAALCAYAGGRALGVGRWPALLPAAVMLLHGSAIWFEHAILTEGPFAFLVCAALPAAALAADPERGRTRRIHLAALAGLLVALATAVRPVGLPLLAVLAAWMAWAPPIPRRERLAASGVLLLTGAGLLAANLAWAHAETGRYSLARHDYYAFYGRVAPFADCTRFTPPPRTERLCPTVPRDSRRGPGYWVFSPESPLVRSIGDAGAGQQPPGAAERVNAFSRAAIRAQPGDYLKAIGRDLLRLAHPGLRFNPNLPAPGGAGGQPRTYPGTLAGRDANGPDAERPTRELVARLYSTDGIRRGDLGGLEDYERATRVSGVPWLILLLLALAGPLLLTGRERRAALMVTAYALTLTVAPIAAHSYDWRFQLVAVGPLAVAAALGLQGIAQRRRRRQDTQGSGSPQGLGASAERPTPS